MATRNSGTALEDGLQKTLKSIQSQKPSFFHRFADAKAARGWLAAQPGDFMWLLPGLPAILIEAKSTQKSAPLKTLLDSGQCGKHRLWLRAGHHTAFIYGDLSTDTLIWYDGASVITPSSTPPLAVWKGHLSDMLTMCHVVAQSLMENRRDRGKEE